MPENLDDQKVGAKKEPNAKINFVSIWMFIGLGLYRSLLEVCFPRLQSRDVWSIKEIKLASGFRKKNHSIGMTYL